ncbi:hypothetical protein DIPPA_28736 [Diplonema papillatum]|nr:hypothetical protein DIPPA_28736 [Diplonema papillatum]
MPVTFVKEAGATDVLLSEDAKVAMVEAVGGDYMVVPIKYAGDVTFEIKVEGFGFEIGQHDPAQGFSRKLTDPFISMIASPAKKAAAHSPRTGTFVVTIKDDSFTIIIPSFEGAPETRKAFITDPTRLAIVLGGQVSATIKDL